MSARLPLGDFTRLTKNQIQIICLTGVIVIVVIDNYHSDFLWELIELFFFVFLIFLLCILFNLCSQWEQPEPFPIFRPEYSPAFWSQWEQPPKPFPRARSAKLVERQSEAEIGEAEEKVGRSKEARGATKRTERERDGVRTHQISPLHDIELPFVKAVPTIASLRLPLIRSFSHLHRQHAPEGESAIGSVPPMFENVQPNLYK